MGYQQNAGGGWSGDLYIADEEQISEAEHPSDIHIRTIPSPEVIVNKLAGKYIFPLAEGRLKQRCLATSARCVCVGVGVGV